MESKAFLSPGTEKLREIRGGYSEPAESPMRRWLVDYFQNGGEVYLTSFDPGSLSPGSPEDSL